MNTPNPTPSNNGAVLPTVGSIIGSGLGMALASALHLNPTDPLTGGAIVGITATAGTALLHWLGVTFKVPGL